MTSYGSYNDIKKPIIADSVIISVSNCTFSFISGFAVWLVVGYLENLGKLDQDQVAGASLAFITYPTAIDTMSNPNVWAVILGLTLFMLGIDSSFSAIEATSTVICDTAWKGKAPRMFIAFVLCLVGLIGSFPFCFNWGFFIFLGCFIIAAVFSQQRSGLCLKMWYHEIMMCGVRRIAYACSQMGRNEDAKTTVLWWEPYFAFYWGILVKFVNPCLLYAIIVSITKTDLEKSYGGYGQSWLVIGWAIPIIGIILLVSSYFLFGAPDQSLNYDEFILEEEKKEGKQNIELGTACKRHRRMWNLLPTTRLTYKFKW